MGLRGGGRCARRRGSGGDEHSENSTVYIFDNGELSEDEIRNEDIIELLPKNRHSRPSRPEEDSMVTWVEVSVKEGDTLTNIALKYNCKVADLKRLNKLISDQDFFGRKRIRVPVIRHGVLEERIQMEDKQSTHHESADGRCIESNENCLLDAESVQSLTLSSRDSQGLLAQELLLRYDQDIQNSMNSTSLEHSNTLGTVLRPPLSRQASRTLSWRTVLIFFVTFCVVVPVVGVIHFIFMSVLPFYRNWWTGVHEEASTTQATTG